MSAPVLMDVDGPTIIRRDFPVEVEITCTDGERRQLPECLVVITDFAAYVWVYPGEAGLVFMGTMPEWRPSQYGRESVVPPFTVETDAGTLSVRKGRGCGCHNALRHFEPFGQR